jgi:hypothetical protein
MTQSPLSDPAGLADRDEYLDMVLSLPTLHQALAARGRRIENKTFTRCLIEGPAVMLVAGGVTMEDCNMGHDGGDLRNLLLKPVGPRQVVGTIPVTNSLFRACRFHAIGFTGDDAFLAGFQRDIRSGGAS